MNYKINNNENFDSKEKVSEKNAQKNNSIIPNVKRIIVLSCCILSFTCTFTTANAQGDLLVTPRRLVFDGSQKTQEINLANIGSDTARYVISTLEYRMTESGSFERIENPDSAQNFASPFLRFYPRSVVLAPNEAQLVKVQLMKTNSLEPGEYRSHLYFRSDKEEKPLGELDAPSDSNNITVSLIPVFGISIPVIILSGETSSAVNISEAVFENKNNVPAVHMTLFRSGNKSAYGDISIKLLSPEGKITQVGLAKGVAVYTPNSKRNFYMNLDNKTGLDYRNAKLLIEYSNPQGIKSDILAQKEISLP